MIIDNKTVVKVAKFMFTGSFFLVWFKWLAAYMAFSTLLIFGLFLPDPLVLFKIFLGLGAYTAVMPALLRNKLKD